MNAHGGNIYDFTSPGRIVDFSSNINQYGPPQWAMEAAEESLIHIRRYPDASQTAIRNAFSQWLGVAPESLVFGNGASELISAIIHALAPGRVITASPTFSGYTESAGQLGVRVEAIRTRQTENFAFPMRELKDTFGKGDVLVICQPNNPTGRAWEEGELMALLEIAESKEGWVIADECFINLTYPRAFSCLPFIGGGRVIVLRAITKDFSAPGLRVGFAAASPDMTRLIRDKIQSWPINCVGESFAVACASRPEPFLSDSAKKISVERARLIRGLKTLGYYPYPSSVNFILARSGRLSANGLYDKLKRKSFLVRRCSNFEGLDDWHFRIAVRGTEDNDAFLCALAEI